MSKFEENEYTKTQITIGKRQSGKTTKLIKRAAEEDLYILTANKDMASCIFRQAKEMGFDILFPLTVDEFMNGLKIRQCRGVPIKGVLIDEAEMVLNEFLHGVPIRGLTLTDYDNIEYLYLPEERHLSTTTENISETFDFGVRMYEKLDEIIFQTLYDFGMREYEMKVDKKELVEAFTLIRTCKKHDIDISDLTDTASTASEMSEKMKKIKLAYKIGYEDGIKHERDAMKKALFPDPWDCLEKGD